MNSRSTSTASAPDRTAGERKERGPRARKPKRARATLLPALLATAVERNPDAIALVDGDRTVSYAELDVRSSTLARLLMNAGAGPESTIAVALQRSVESITAMWAVMKTGAAFLPIDPSYPTARIEHMVGDSGATRGITISAHRDALPSSCEWTFLDDESVQTVLASLPGDPISTVERTSTLRAANAAYVIYTSGSTGLPKGVVVTQAGLASLCAHAVRVLELTPQSRTLHFTSPSFDVSVFDYLLAIGSSATMIIAPPDNYGGAELEDLLRREKVTHGFSTPAALTSIDGDELPDLAALVVGGEAFGADLVARWAPGRALFNGYGPTEASIFATMSAPLVVGEPVTMGEPVDGMKAYVLDARLSVVPPGVAGELYLAGPGVARGYHRRSALTASRFLPDPFDPSGSRMYRTGDLVRVDASGDLEYLGRNDFQVKIRGFRVELGEIDAVLGGHPEVDFALTIGTDAGAGSTALVSYALPADGTSPESSTLLEWMRQSLPGHMVPSALMLIDHVPLTGAGKVDRSALPAPVFVAREYRAPSTPTEEAVASVFAELLSRESVGVDDDFFDLGGNSLIGTQVAARIGARLHKRVPARVLFDEPSVSGLAAAIDAQEQEDRVDLEARPRPARIPLSLAQQRMWFLNRFDPSSSAYNIPIAVRLSGELNVDAVRLAVADVIERHESLRTIYPSDDTGPHQVVLESGEAGVAVSLTRTTKAKVAADVQATLDCAFDVTSEVPIRVTLFEVTETEHVLVVVVHHIAADGSSVGPLIRDVMLAYTARSSGREPGWAPLEIQYADYTLWQRELLGDENDTKSAAHAQIQFWTSELAGLPDQLNLPFDRPRPAVQSMVGGEVAFDIDADLHANLQEVARNSNASLFMIVHAAWAVTLSRLSQRTDIAIGSPIAGRGEAKLDDLIGMFANTVVFRTLVRWESQFTDFLATVRDTDLEAFGHADVPFETLVGVLDPARSTARHPLFQVGLSFQNLARTHLELPGLDVTGVDSEVKISKFDLHLVVSDTYGNDGAPAGMHAALTYASSLFESSTAAAITTTYMRVLRAVVDNPSAVIGDIDVLGSEDRTDVLEVRNDTAEHVDPAATLVSLFDARVAADPKAPAIVCGQAVWSYSEFDGRVNALARVLIGEGFGPESLVALALPRSPELLVAMYAVVKAGAAYVPLDPAQPLTRTDQILGSAQPAAVLTSAAVGFATETNVRVIELDTVETAGFSCEPVRDDERTSPLRPGNTAYVIFTSGSTGAPKGVAVEHASVVNQLEWMRHEYRSNAQDSTVLKTPVTFDLSVWELWSMPTSGGRIVVAEQDRHGDVQYLNALMAAEEVSTLFVVPSMLGALGVDGLPNALERVLVIGEAFPPHTAAQVSAGRDFRLDNLYGPTEATVSVTRHRLIDSRADSIPIGTPEWNTRVFVLDPRLAPVPDGVVGELYVAGVQLARGYHGRPDLTAERFVADPFGRSGRLYRTGDLVRWTKERTLDFVGRADFQVKIRGYRIELGDIELALRAVDGIVDAVAIDRTDRHLGTRLVGYIVGDVDVSLVKAILAQRLPSYMVPTALVVLDAIPLTANGKIDRAALPEPVFETTEYRKPSTSAEETVAQIITQLLGATEVGADDDFFALGGNSLLATQLVSRLGVAMDTQVPVRAVFEAPTVAALAARVAGHAGNGAGIALAARERPAVIPLSLAQRRMWFLGRLNPESTVDNIPVAVRLTGSLNLRALQDAIEDVVARHEILRTVYPDTDGVGSQRILSVDDVELDLRPRDASTESLIEQVTSTVAAPFDLANQVPLRTQILRLAPDDHVLVLVTHHIAADGYSMTPLARDVMIAYSARVLGDEPNWTPLPVQYADYTLWQLEALGASEDPASIMAQQEGFWAAELNGLPGQLDLPVDHPRPTVMSGRGDSVAFEIDRNTHRRIAQLARTHRCTPFMVFHAALAVVLARLSGSWDVAVGTPVAGRGDAALDDLVGMFVGTLVLRTQLDPAQTFDDVLDEVVRTDLAAFDNSDVPFERIVEVLDPPRSQSRHPLVQVLLAFQNLERTAFELPGLTVSAVDLPANTAKMDLQFTVAEQWDAEDRGPGDRTPGTATGYVVTMTYARDLFDEASIVTLGERLTSVLEQVVVSPDAVVGDVDLRSDAARGEVLSSGVEVVGSTETVAELVGSQVVRDRTAVAVSFGGVSLSYEEFGVRVARTARWLISMGVGPESRVVVSMRRSVEMVVVVHAVVVAGGAYVPVDPDGPVERSNYVVEVVDPVLVVSEVDEAAVAGFSGDVVTDADRRSPLRATNAAYVMFTSGSTGRPKGVAVSHEAVVNQLSWLVAEFGLGEGDVVLQKTPFTFDVSVWELFGALVCGARLVVAEPGGHRDVGYVASVIESEGVTAVSFVPSMLSVFVGGVGDADVSSLRHVLVAGEAFGTSVAVSAAKVLASARLHNLYGPTEFAVHATAFFTGDVGVGGSGVPIGVPVWNSSVAVLDSRLHPVPVGVVGELYLSGVQLARGYFGRSGLSAERFVASPFVGGGRMYRTGDLVRWDRFGDLHFVSRADGQIKLRGQRIELGEIESVLGEHGSVDRAVVEVRGDRLVAYVVGVDGRVDGDVLKSFVGDRVPSYMVPSVFVPLDVLPVTASGKLDRGALVDPVVSVGVFRAPVSEAEVVVAGVFEDVLGVDRVGVDDDFFALGGNSLIATQVASRVGALLGVRVPVGVLFELSSVGALAGWVVSGSGVGVGAPLVARVRPDVVPLSLAQQRMWFLNRLEPESAVYNVPLAVRMSGSLDTDALGLAVHDVLARHETLRTVYPVIEGTPVQRVMSVDDIRLDLTPVSVSEAEIEHRVTAVVSGGFDVESQVPIRAALFAVAPDEHVLVVVVHHIAADGSSIAPLARDVMVAYGSRSRGSAPTWEPLSVQYADFTLWQREALGAAHDPTSLAHSEIGYWRGQLDGLPETLGLPLDRPRSAVRSTQGASVDFDLDEATLAGIERVSREHGVTRFMVVHAALAATLARWSGESDIAVGTPTAGRGEQELDNLIGMFVNTLVLRTDVDPKSTFVDLFGDVRETDIGAFGHATLPFDWLVDELAPVRSTAHSPLFQVLIVFQNFAQEELALDGLSVAHVDSDTRTAKYDLQFSFVDMADADRNRNGLSMSVTYSTALFDRESISAVGRRFASVLSAAVTDPTTAIGDVDLVDEVDRAALSQWNSTGHELDRSSTLVSMFEAQVVRTPDAIALIEDDRSLTYLELDRRVNRTARALVARGLHAESTAAVYMTRSIEMVVAMYAVLKTGAAYIPLDPEQPLERNHTVLDSAKPVLVVVAGSQHHRAPSYTEVIDLDEIALDSWSDEPMTDEDRERPLRPNALAYIMFTSGSTGRPKGIELTHAATANQLAWAQSVYPLDSTDAVLHKTPITFDVSVWELFWTLQTGARLVLAEPGGHRDPAYLSEVIDRFSITTLHFVPSMLSAYAHAVGGLGTSVRRVFAAGEALTPAISAQFHELNEADLHNWYGPAEVEVVTAVQVFPNTSKVTVGKPVWNTTAHVLDARLRPVPVGVPGELYIGGSQLARGYRGRPALTSERFVADPYEPGARIYRTGDLVHWTPEGELVYRGRTDFQIELRGQRIEPGEIEAVLSQNADVQSAAVILHRDDTLGERLVAYVGSSTGIEPADLSAEVAAVLPAYMVPSAIIVLPALPLGPTGKLDRRALPEPTFQAAEYRTPQSDTERAVASIVGDLLGIVDPGLDDDFFVLGGNSLIATQLVARTGDALGRRIPIRTLFEAPTIEKFAARVDLLANIDDRPMLSARPRPARIPLSYSQQRMWIENRKNPTSSSRNIPVAVRLTGALNVPALQAAVDDLLDRHEALRTVFPEFDGNGYQEIRPTGEVRLDLSPTDIGKGAVTAVVEEFVGRGFDVTTQVPIRATLLRVSDEEHVTVFVAHHIAADGFSMRPLTTDLMVAYAARVVGDVPQWEPLAVQYADYTLWHHELLGTEDAPSRLMSDQLRYWRRHLDGLVDRIELPFDRRPGPSTSTRVGATAEFPVSPDLTAAVESFARTKHATSFMVVHAALAVLIGRMSSSSDIAFSAPIAGRGEPELDGLIGMFVNSVVLRSAISASDTFDGVVDQVREADLNAFAHSDAPFDRVMAECTRGGAEGSRPPLQMALTYQNLGWSSLELSGLLVASVGFDARVAKYELHFSVEESVDAAGLPGLVFAITYDTALFDASTVSRIGADYVDLVEAVVRDPFQQVGCIALRSSGDHGD
ncbi:non-ribosomal peptide synthetase [Rhodococcus sp. P1Y]|uniref:non-ribosomal peptide synthetase n=1 Tax=Rhodococcus sp. P1Y TaxID=1302308 RepID=UPI000EABC6DC|nr:non-ribosomal peptide synthetase [Rhodococcus sp. P1Y]AYJ49065.1 amino acid adenylation domain-containing protein [Rhodococcus sp. P1Y]